MFAVEVVSVRASGGSRRQERRWDVRLPAALRCIDQPSVVCRAKDVSRRGLRLSVFDDIAVDTRVAINVPFLRSIAGRVIWCRDLEVGVQFDTPLSDQEIVLLVERYGVTVGETLQTSSA